MHEISISHIISQLRVLNAAVRETKTAREWENLIRKKSLIAYSDLDESNTLTKSDFKEDSLNLTKDAFLPSLNVSQDMQGSLMSEMDASFKDNSQIKLTDISHLELEGR